MNAHSLNLVVRFLLEIAALAILAAWGWYSRNDELRFVAAVSVPILCAVLWGTFAVPHDPTRSGSAPVPVSGVVRLALELSFFASATAALAHLGFVRPAITFGAAVAIHYLLSYDRVRWLVIQ
jgi:hypothetical protein